MKLSLSVVTLVNDPLAYAMSRATLELQHPGDELQWIPVDADSQGWNASNGLNLGLEQCEADWALCAHQDVLYPRGWWNLARQRLSKLPAEAGVVALMGVTRRGAFRGHVLDPHGHCRWGPLPSPIVSVDEHALLIRMETSLRFDPEAPGFHCYGTDLALQALSRRIGVYAIDAPVVHLSGGTEGKQDKSFEEAARWLFAKWSGSVDGVLSTPSDLLWDRRISTLPRWLRAKWERRRSHRQRHAGPVRLNDDAGLSRQDGAES